MGQTIHEKLDLLQEHIKNMSGILIDADWCDDLLYPYYEHFNDKSDKYKGGSLLAFWGLLLDWKDGSGFPFYTGGQDYECHRFDKYLEGFLNYSSDIKGHFPNIYYLIINSLMFLDNKDGFEDTFPNISSDLFEAVRKILFHDNIQKLDEEVYKNAIEEAGMSLS